MRDWLVGCKPVNLSQWRTQGALGTYAPPRWKKWKKICTVLCIFFNVTRYVNPTKCETLCANGIKFIQNWIWQPKPWNLVWKREMIKKRKKGHQFFCTEMCPPLRHISGYAYDLSWGGDGSVCGHGAEGVQLQNAWHSHILGGSGAGAACSFPAKKVRGCNPRKKFWNSTCKIPAF